MDLLKQRAIETMQWFQTRPMQENPASILRSEALKPVVALHDDFRLAEHHFLAHWQSWEGTPAENQAFYRAQKQGATPGMTAAEHHVYMAETEGLIPVEDWRLHSRWSQAKKALREAERMATFFQRQSTVEALAIRRGQLLRQQGILPDLTDHLPRGSFLVGRDPDDSHVDGGAWQASQGLFDSHDLPPWDCWMLYALPEGLFSPHGAFVPSSALQDLVVLQGGEYPRLAWIPELYVDLTNEAIRCSIGDCMVWAADADTPVTRHLKGLGFHL